MKLKTMLDKYEKEFNDNLKFIRKAMETMPILNKLINYESYIRFGQSPFIRIVEFIKSWQHIPDDIRFVDEYRFERIVNLEDMINISKKYNYCTKKFDILREYADCSFYKMYEKDVFIGMVCINFKYNKMRAYDVNNSELDKKYCDLINKVFGLKKESNNSQGFSSGGIIEGDIRREAIGAWRTYEPDHNPPINNSQDANTQNRELIRVNPSVTWITEEQLQSLLETFSNNPISGNEQVINEAAATADIIIERHRVINEAFSRGSVYIDLPQDLRDYLGENEE